MINNFLNFLLFFVSKFGNQTFYLWLLKKLPPEQVLQVESQILQTLSEGSPYSFFKEHSTAQLFVDVTPQYAVGVLRRMLIKYKFLGTTMMQFIYMIFIYNERRIFLQRE